MNATREYRPPPAGLDPSRRIGRFVLVSLLARSARTLTWRATDPHHQQDRILMMPRQPPVSADGLQAWLSAARRTVRLSHPQLASPCEVSSQGGWPFAVYEAGDGETLASRLGSARLGPRDAAPLVLSLARAVAHAHEVGLVHGDLRSDCVLVDAAGRVWLLGLQVALLPSHEPRQSAGPPVEPDEVSGDLIRRQRLAAQRDVLALGLLLHHALIGRAPLDEADLGLVIDRLPPWGRELVRLPWNTPDTVPQALRAIVNRATDRQPRQRYRSARTMAQALEGYLLAEASPGVGALARLRERVGSVGALPPRDGMAANLARLALLERSRTRELAQLVIEDVALTLELIRRVNTAVVRGVRVSDNGPVLTVRRAIALLGVSGVRRAAMSLPSWPVPPEERPAHPLHAALERSAWAVRLAQELRPAQWDAEVVAVVTVLQNLGRLLVTCHLPADAAQIAALTSPLSRRADEAEDPGMSELGASYAVLGVDMEAVGRALLRHWGLGEEIARWVRRAPMGAVVATPQSDDDFLRLVASCATEAVEAAGLPSHRREAGLSRVLRRYGEPLDLTPAVLLQALSRSMPRPPEDDGNPSPDSPDSLDAASPADAAGRQTEGDEP